MTFLASLYDGKLGYTAQQDRNLISTLLLPGIVGTNDCLVSSGSGLSSIVAAGSLIVPNTFIASRGGNYFCTNDASVAVTHNAGDATNPRIDSIYVKVFDSEPTGGGGDSSDSTQAIIVPGNPTSGATLANLSGVGSPPTNSYLLAHVLVPARSTASALFTYEDERSIVKSGPAFEPAFSTYKNLSILGRGRAFPTQIAGTYSLPSEAMNSIVFVVGTDAGDATFYLDPADYDTRSRTTRYRLRAQIFTNAVAPGITFTVGLYPIASWAGASGAHPTVNTLGSVVTGSTATFASPSTNVQTTRAAEFTAPDAGWYILGVALSGTIPVNCYTNIVGVLDMRQI